MVLQRWRLAFLWLLPMLLLIGGPRSGMAAPPPEALQAAREGAQGYGSGLGLAFPMAHWNPENRLLYETWLFQLAGNTITMTVVQQPDGWAAVSYSSPGLVDLEALQRAQALLTARGLPEDAEPGVFTALQGMNFWLLRAEGQEFLYPMGPSRDRMMKLGLSPDELHDRETVTQLLPRLIPKWHQDPQVWFALIGWALGLAGLFFLLSILRGWLRRSQRVW